VLSSLSQGVETVGAGVVDFLISNPKTANRMNSTDKAALNVIGNLLYTAGQRKHEMNVANAGKQQVILQESSGKQVTFVIDPSGKHYIVHKGIVYPIEQQIIKQAENEFVPKKTIQNEYLPPYDIQSIGASFYFDEIPINYGKEGVYNYTVTEKKGEYLYEIAKKLNVSVYDFEYEHIPGPSKSKTFRKMLAGKKKAPKSTKFIYNIKKKEYLTRVPFLFTCKWARDFDDDGYDFDDFQGVKNSFTKDEEILIVSGYQTDKDSCIYSLEVFVGESGKLLFRREGDAIPFHKTILEKINAEVLNPGSYIYILKVRKNSRTLASKKERFEIRGE